MIRKLMLALTMALAASAALAQNIPLPNTGAFGAAVTPDGSKLFVPEFGTFWPWAPGHTVAVIDTATHAVIGVVDVGWRPEDVAITPDGKRAYVTNSSSATVSVIDVATLAVTATITLGTEEATYLYGIAIRPDGKKAYVTSNGADFDGSDENIFVIDVDASSPTYNTKVGGIVLSGVFSRPALRKNGKELVVPRGAAGNDFNASPEIAFFSTVTNTYLESVKIQPLPGGFHGVEDIAITPNGDFAYAPFFSFGSGSDEVFVIDLKKRKLTDIARVGSGDIAQHGVAIRPDGLLVGVTNWDAGTVSWIFTPTHTVVGVTVVGTNPNELVFTPDGLQAFVTNQNSNSVSAVPLQSSTDVVTTLVALAISDGTPSADAKKDLAARVQKLQAAIAKGVQAEINERLDSLVLHIQKFAAKGEFTVGVSKDLFPPSAVVNGVTVTPGGIVAGR